MFFRLAPAAVRRLSRFAGRVSVWTFALLIPQVLLAGTLSVQIDGVDDALKPAVTAAAEIMQYDKREVSAAQARRLYDRAPEQVAKSLEAYGYYNATADGELKEAPPGFVAVLHVHPGEATTVATLKVGVPD